MWPDCAVTIFIEENFEKCNYLKTDVATFGKIGLLFIALSGHNNSTCIGST